MKRMLWVGALLGGAVASGCVLRDVRVGDDDGSGQAGGGGGGGGAPVDTPWGCLDQEPKPPAGDGIYLFLEVVGATTRAPLTTVTVRACSRIEPDCTNPIGPPVKVDAAGRATIPVVQNFDIYLEVFNGDDPTIDDPTFVRTLVYFPPSEIARGAVGRVILGFSSAQMQSLAALSGGSFNGETGLVSLTALDCQNEPAANVSYDVLTRTMTTPETREYYTVDGVPSTSATKTDASGTGGFTNILPGVASFSAAVERNEIERDVTLEAGASVFVRPGWHTQLYVAP